MPSYLVGGGGNARRFYGSVVVTVCVLLLLLPASLPAASALTASRAHSTAPDSVYSYDGLPHIPEATTAHPVDMANWLVRSSAIDFGHLYDVLANFNATNTAELPGLSATQAQLEAKFKHAADFGVAEARGAEGFSAFGKAVDAFVTDSGTVRVTGTYRGNPAILNYNPTTAQVVVQATDGTFISGWQMSPAQLQNVITRASLGGG